MRIPTDTEYALLEKFLEYYRLYQKDRNRDLTFSIDHGDFENICADLGLAVRVLASGRIEVANRTEGVNAKEAFDELYAMYALALKGCKLKRKPEWFDAQFGKFGRLLHRALGLEQDAVRKQKDIPWKKRRTIIAKKRNIPNPVWKAGMNVFAGSEEAFERWLYRKNGAFQDEKPIDVIQCPPGDAAVLSYLEALLHGPTNSLAKSA